MNNIYQHYIIDLSSNNNFVQIPAMQGDGNSIRGFEIELIQNGIPYIIDREDTLISIMGTKPDTSQIMNPCELTEEGCILVDITSQMTAVKGRGDYQIVLFGRSTNSQLKSFPFYLLTTPATFDIDHITSSDEFQALTRNITRTESVIDDASQAISDIRDLETSVETNESSRVRAEESRVLAEGRREEAEATRVTSENIRKSNETGRQTAESDRSNAENARASAESVRESNENTRIENENHRKTNENNREKAETARVNAESDRAVAENGRVNAENIRVESENARNVEETARNASEANRINAENIRKSNEDIRQENEIVRQSNETARQLNEDTRKSSEEFRQSNEAARETAEADRTQTEMDRVSAEEIRQKNEALRIENETSRQEAEDSRNSAEEARETAEVQRKNAEEARVLQEATRQENETFRQENEASRQEKLTEAVTHAQSAADRAEKAAETAGESVESALQSALRAESYAHGGTGTREGEDTDNADFYYQQSKALHDNILAAGGASEENAGLMSAHDKSWLDGKFRRYIYGSDSAGEDKRGYYKIASVESDLLNHSYAIRLLIWSPNHANFPVAPIEVTVYFQTGNSSNNSTKVFAYCDLATTSSRIFKDIVVKHTVNAAVGKCEIYFDRNIDTATITIDVMGEMERNVTTSEEKYQKVWTFYDNFIAPDPIEEEGYVLKPLIECMNGATVGSDTTPIYIDKGIPKPCTNLPSGTTNYKELNNKPSINGVTLLGNKTASDLMMVKSTGTTNLGLEKADIAIGYVAGSKPIYGIDDGALFEHAYSELWCQQIYGDYRTGQIATRGKNNGNWQAWRRQLDQFNYPDYITAYDARVHSQIANIDSNKYIKIRITRAALNGAGFMGSFTVRIYQNYVATDYLVSGYNYLNDQNNKWWLNPKVAILGSSDPAYSYNVEPIVRFGYEPEYLWVMFDIDHHVGVSVFGINSGYYSLNDNVNIGNRTFSIQFVSEITGTTVATIRPMYPVLNGVSEFRIGSFGMIRTGGSGSIELVSNGYDTASSYRNPRCVGIYSLSPVDGGGGTFRSAVNGDLDLGWSGKRWRNIYSTTALNVSSDSREKIDQKPLNEELTEKFVLGLKPKSYKRIDGTSGRRHHGLIAQEIEELMENLGISSLDFAGFIKSPKTEEIEEEDPETGEMTKTCREIEGEYIYSLRYEEFLPMLIKMIQIQHDKIKALENENLRLSERMSRIEEYLELV